MNIRSKRAQSGARSGLGLASTEGGRVALGAGVGAAVALGLAAAFFNAGAALEAPSGVTAPAEPFAPSARAAAGSRPHAGSRQRPEAAAEIGGAPSQPPFVFQPSLEVAATIKTDVGDGLDHLAARAQAFWRAGSGAASTEEAQTGTTPTAAPSVASREEKAAEHAAANAELEAAMAAIIAARAPTPNADALSPARREALERRRLDAVAEALEVYAATAARLGRSAAALEASNEASALRVAALHRSPDDPALAQAAYRSLIRLGDAFIAASRPGDATRSFRDAHALAERLSVADANQGAAPLEARQRDLAMAAAKLGAALEPTEPVAARRRYREALAVFGELDARDALPASDYGAVALLIQRVRTPPAF